jgi:transposase
LESTREVNNYWFLNFLTSRKGLPKLARLRRASLLKIPGIGQKYADLIQAWQIKAFFSHDVDLVGDMIQQDAKRLLELREQIKALKQQMARVAKDSAIARQLDTIPGFGLICTAELAGEIGTIERFRKESRLAVYLGMANLDHSSGKSRRSKRPKHVNVRAKAAMRIAADKHRKLCPQSKRYYEKRRAEGKTHHQAIRALGRHLCPVIFKMLKEDRPYRIEP